MAAPFRVHRCGSPWHHGWTLRKKRGDRYVLVDCFSTQAKAIDYAYKNWPWWP